jgi:hypothetical protein
MDSAKASKEDLFGFVLSYNNKPCFYEFYKDEFIKCNQLQLLTIQQSLETYKQTPAYRQFSTTTGLWGYIIMRNKGYKKEFVMKFVESIKDKQSRYPPGPGNVCIENNAASRMNNILKLITKYLPDWIDISEQVTMKNKRNISCLLEIIFRYTKGSFYGYDKIWLKYF